MISYLKQKSDLIGALASFVCMVHCIITPFLFIATVCSTSCCASAPWWWVWLDFFFLLISFFAVYKSTQNSSKPWMKIALWIAWGALFSAILMEQLSVLFFSEYYKHTAAFLLIGLHLYNLKYCQCKSDTCCVNNEN